VIRFARGEPPRAAREAELLDLGSALHGLHLTVDEVFATLRIPR
jgi:hypothetical protein